MNQEFNAEVIRTCARLLHNLAEARAVLQQIGYPMERVPSTTENAREFWATVVERIENGVIEGDNRIGRLIDAARTWYSGNDELRKLSEILAAETAADTGAAPTAHAARPQPRLDVDGPCFALLFVESDQHAEFLDLVRREVSPQAELLYATRQQSAVGVPDPGNGAAEIVSRLQAQLARWPDNPSVTYSRYDIRPYLFSSIVVYGPDGAPYDLRGVPATTLVRDIPFAVLSQYQDEAVQDRQGRFVDTVVDHIGPTGTVRRLSPDQTLHEANFSEGDSMRVSAQATAGTAWFQQSVDLARAQIADFAKRNPEFVIAGTDHIDLPTKFTIELSVPGFAPPERFDTDLLEPRLVDRHTLKIVLGRDFPRQPPVVFFESAIFHPNIVRKPINGLPTIGAVCLGPLMDAYRPDLDIGELCQMVVDMVRYRNYEVRKPDTFVDTEGFVDVEAASWARSPAGQQRILAIGGQPLPSGADEDADDRGPHSPLWIRPWGSWDDHR